MSQSHLQKSNSVQPEILVFSFLFLGEGLQGGFESMSLEMILQSKIGLEYLDFVS